MRIMFFGKGGREKMEPTDYCLICGSYVPEGRQVCHACAARYGLEELCGADSTFKDLLAKGTDAILAGSGMSAEKKQ